MSTETGPGALGEFLQARRARRQPDAAGVRTWNEKRRVPGLRRDELARLAGVSTPYYARLEQGSSRNASAEVLDALAGALGLDVVEAAHLHDLARVPGQPRDSGELTGAAATALAAIGLPAVVLNRAMDVLAWNEAGHALMWSHRQFDARPNTALAVFGDRQVRDLFVDRGHKMRAVVAYLRHAQGRDPNDPRLRAVLTELAATSTEFGELWNEHAVGDCPGDDYELRHPQRGRTTVTQLTLQPVGADGQLLIAWQIAQAAAS